MNKSQFFYLYPLSAIIAAVLILIDGKLSGISLMCIAFFGLGVVIYAELKKISRHLQKIARKYESTAPVDNATKQKDVQDN